jgi:hypothetical protein
MAADAICEIIIVQGVQRIVNSRFDAHQRDIGGALTKAGLLLQAAMFVLFVLLAAIFHRRASKMGVLKPGVRTVLIVLYISCSIVTARCIYRIVEFFEWGNGPLSHVEAYFYVFEASIMLTNTVMLNYFHPGKYLPRSNKVFLAKDGITEVHGPGWKDKRPFIATVLDPFDLYGLLTGVDTKTRFWDMEPAELDALTAEHRRKKAEKLALPRPSWQKFLDPLHLFGSRGLIVTQAKKLEKEPKEEPCIEEKSSGLHKAHDEPANIV